MAYQVPLVFLKLSDTLTICATRVVGMMSTESRQARLKLKADRDNGTLINGCGRNRAKTLIMLDNGAVASSPHTINHLCKLLEFSNGKRVVKTKPNSKSGLKLVDYSDVDNPDENNELEVPDSYLADESDTNIKSE